MENTEVDGIYKYTFAGGPANSYFFTTRANVIYEIKFVPSTDYFGGYSTLTVEVFEMVIAVVDNPGGGRLPADERTALTVFTIFENFFRPHSQALIFICDSSDGREQARFRKFNTWFYNKITMANNLDMDLAKFDQHIVDGTRLILLSLILSRRHPQRKLIVDIFMELGEEEK